MGEVIAFHPHLSPIATALADEGVPIRVISRAMRVPSDDMRTHLHEAQERGELIELPVEDWPPTARRADRVPTASQADIDQIAVGARYVFKATAQEAAVLSTLLMRNEATKEQLLSAVQHQRVNKNSMPNDMDEPHIKLIDVVVCKVRKKIKTHGVQIDTMWGRGYSMPREHRVLALRLISEYISGGKSEGENDQSIDAGETGLQQAA